MIHYDQNARGRPEKSQGILSRKSHSLDERRGAGCHSGNVSIVKRMRNTYPVGIALFKGGSQNRPQDSPKTVKLTSGLKLIISTRLPRGPWKLSLKQKEPMKITLERKDALRRAEGKPE